VGLCSEINENAMSWTGESDGWRRNGYSILLNQEGNGVMMLG
jgi:hypothetical protein